jgi:hypothetical protein
LCNRRASVRPSKLEQGRRLRRFGFVKRLLVLGLLCALLSGCGVAAFPCRVGGAAVDMVPLVGHPAATPFNACAGAIDPGG